MKSHLNLVTFILLFLGVKSFGPASAETIYSSEIPKLVPIKKLDVFNLYGENALNLAKNCGLNLDEHKQYWRPSLRQLQIIDKRVEKKLLKENLKLSKKRFQRLYFGLSKGLSDKKVVVLIYPGAKEELDAMFGMGSVDCIRISRKLIFDVQTMKVELL